jgi:restriction system protein
MAVRILGLRLRGAAADNIADGSKVATLCVSGLIVPAQRTPEGTLVACTTAVWQEIVNLLDKDWSQAFNIPPDKWEELIAGAFDKLGYKTTLTPRSGDHGRDVIAISEGIGCIKIIGSVKAYKPSHLVGYDDVRALLGVLSGEQDASKGIITTTSDFPPNIGKDPFISGFMPTRLELVNGSRLQDWFKNLSSLERVTPVGP